MKKLIFTACLVQGLCVMMPAGAQDVDYSPAFFGPHAMQVPEVSDGRIPEQTLAGFSADYSAGRGGMEGSRTVGFRLDAEFPLAPRHVSFKLWYDFYELYNNGGRRGHGAGDVYIQTRISVLGEREKRPQIIIGATIKTASGGNFTDRRFYDTPGYWFDFQIAKSFFFLSEAVSEVRLVGQAGFLCWETTGSVQNDAPMYGLNVILSNRWLSLENQLAGYWGWMNNGDRPLSFRTKLTYKYKFADIFFQYQYGVFDFPYHQIRLGCSFSIPRLTPRYR